MFKKFFSGLTKNFMEKTTMEETEKAKETMQIAKNIEAGPIITIAREFGSGGREIALKLAQKLNLEFYDKEKIVETAKERGIDISLFEQLEEEKMDDFWFHVSPKEYDIPQIASSYEEKVSNDKMFMIQSDTIRDVAQKGNAVFVGRCASYILKNKAKKIFITANLEDKIKRIEKRYDLTREKAMQLIQAADQKREKYYDYYTNTKWNDAKNYDLVVDVSKMGIDGAVNEIARFVKRGG